MGLVTALLLLQPMAVRAQDADASEADQIINAPPPGDAERPEGSMLITASEQASFNAGEKIAVFEGEVTVDDVQFSLTARKLTVYLDEEGGGLKSAEAEGDVFIVQKKDEKTDRGESTAKAMKAVYNPVTGDILLTGWPQVRQGINLHKASEFSTRMTLNRDGQLQTDGPSATFIQDQEARQ